MKMHYSHPFSKNPKATLAIPEGFKEIYAPEGRYITTWFKKEDTGEDAIMICTTTHKHKMGSHDVKLADDEVLELKAVICFESNDQLLSWAKAVNWIARKIIKYNAEGKE